jgi:hypothetical protein
MSVYLFLHPSLGEEEEEEEEEGGELLFETF